MSYDVENAAERFNRNRAFYLASEAPVVDDGDEFAPPGSTTRLVKAVARIEVALANRCRTARGSRNRAERDGDEKQRAFFAGRVEGLTSGLRAVSDLRDAIERGVL